MGYVMDWHIEHVRGARAALVNRSGRTAYDVVVASAGRVVVHGQRNWQTSRDAMEDREGIEFKYARAGGAHQDPPRLRVEYSFEPDGHRL